MPHPHYELVGSYLKPTQPSPSAPKYFSNKLFKLAIDIKYSLIPRLLPAFQRLHWTDFNNCDQYHTWALKNRKGYSLSGLSPHGSVCSNKSEKPVINFDLSLVDLLTPELELDAMVWSNLTYVRTHNK